MFRWLLLLSILTVAVSDRVLILLESMATRDSHSIFFKTIADRGHVLTYKNADEGSLSLIKFGELLYEHLIVFAPSVDEFGGTLTASEVGRFVDEGGNVLLAGDGLNLGTAIRDIGADNGFEFADQLIDHFNYDSVLDDGKHTTVVLGKEEFMNAPLIVGDLSKMNPVLYKGGALVPSKKNRLRLDLVKASRTAYAHNPNKPITSGVSAAGSKGVLVSGLQARNNARVVISGSLLLFSNAFINAQVNKAGEKSVRSGNLEFVTELSKWLLKEKGVLRVKNVQHHRVGEVTPPREYTIMETVEYTIEVEELKDGKWLPFKGTDVQLQFVRIDPFVRTTLTNKNGRLSTRFKLPDVYGVFKFMVDHRRVGYTHVYDVQQVSVRPLWHNQYERFIRSAFPYYASSFSVMLSVILFSCVFLYHKPPPLASPAKKTH